MATKPRSKRKLPSSYSDVLKERVLQRYNDHVMAESKRLHFFLLDLEEDGVEEGEILRVLDEYKTKDWFSLAYLKAVITGREPVPDPPTGPFVGNIVG